MTKKNMINNKGSENDSVDCEYIHVTIANSFWQYFCERHIQQVLLFVCLLSICVGPGIESLHIPCESFRKQISACQGLVSRLKTNISIEKLCNNFDFHKKPG